MIDVTDIKGIIAALVVNTLNFEVNSIYLP